MVNLFKLLLVPEQIDLDEGKVSFITEMKSCTIRVLLLSF